jgi:hypothetical protein
MTEGLQVVLLFSMGLTLYRGVLESVDGRFWYT